MKKEIFELDKFNIIQDDENYYFFRSLEPGDIEDIEKGTIKQEEGYSRLRTDRERWEETHEEVPHWNSDSRLSLEEMFMHIKMHYSLQTNCISLSSNANVARTYGEAFSDKYVMIKVPKKEMGNRVFHAGPYMLAEIERMVNETIENTELPQDIVDEIRKIDLATNSNEIQQIIKTRYTSEKAIDTRKAGMRKGITYRSPHTRVSSYQALNEEQTLEKNKIIAKLTILEKSKIMNPIISNASNNNLLIQTLGSAFSSSEQIYYGDIEGERITDISKELLDMFGLLQQAENQDEQIVDELKRKLITFVSEGNQLQIEEGSILRKNNTEREDISIEEMYELTEGKVEYGQANSIVKNMFYLAKGQQAARALAEELRKITNDDPKYEKVIEYIENNGFKIEPKISTRQTGKGYKLSESVNLNLKQNEIELVEQISRLTDQQQMQIIEEGGLSNVANIMNNTFAKTKRNKKISKEEYYAEAIFSLYNWKKVGIEEFTIEEKNNFMKRMQNEYCMELYQKLEEQGIEREEIPTILLNMITRKEDFKIEENDTEENIKQKRLEQYDRMIKENLSNLKDELSIEKVERFLGYYDVEQTKIQLRPYQQRALEKTDEIFEKNRFASVILPTGAGKSFVTLAQLMEHKDEEMLYLAPQNEILEQIKDYIIEHIHGPINTIGRRSKDEIVADVFPNLKFSTYPGLLAREGKELINKEYGFVVLDELHRTGAEKWGDKLNTLINNQPNSTKVLGITATPRRDVDGINMANEMAERLGYTNREAVQGKHIAMNMSLTNAIRMGLVVNPKLISCAYNLIADGSLDSLKEKIEQIEDINEKNEKLEEYEKLRRNIGEAGGIEQILQANVKKGGKYIVFLPVMENLEDEDGNVIGRKKGKDKIQDYQRQIAEYFKGSDITPNFHSMLGEYGDKENEKRLKEFQNRTAEDTEFMLVMNKANEGLHLDKLDGIIWLRPLDDDSRILYLQQLGRVIYSEDPDNPTKDEDRPVVIDLVNNTLKVNWENEITEQDDIELLTIIVDWAQRHDGTLPDINSSDKEETGYASVLKEIKKKYEEYLEKDLGDLEENKIEEIQEILSLGAQIDLWQAELPDKIMKPGETTRKTFGKTMAGSFEITGILKDFLEIKNDVESITRKTAYEELIEWLDTHDGKKPRGAIGRNGKQLKVGEMTEEEQEERNLYARWSCAKEKKILDEYAGKPIEEVPEEYRGKIAKLREYGLGMEEKTLYEELIEWLNTHDGKMPKSIIRRNGKTLKVEEMTKEEQEERKLYARWRYSKENKILGEYVGKPIEEVPEEYRAKIAKLREYGLGMKEKTTYEEVIEWLDTHDGKMPRSMITRNGKQLKVGEMTEEEQEERNLYARWNNSKEKKILDEYAGKPIEEVPEEYREKIAKLREHGLGMEEKTPYKEPYEELIEWLNTHDGKMPKSIIRRNGKFLKVEEMTKEEQEERNLYRRWKRSKEKKILDEYAGKPIEEVPEEYRGKIAKLREYGLGMEEKTPYKEPYEELIEWLDKHDGKMLRGEIRRNGKTLKVEEMTEEENAEKKLYQRWNRSKENKILCEYAGKPIEEVPEEYRGKIAKLREYGLGMEEKTPYEELIEWLDKHDGKMPRGAIRRNGKTLKVEEMTEEEQEERNLYARWSRTKEKKILDEYAGRTIEEVPKEYRGKIAKLREYGIDLKQRKRTGKEIAEASISSIKDIKMADMEYMVLKKLVKTKEGGINKDEQS